MTERPLIFSAPMVRAILAGKKSITRRLLKPQPPSGATYTGVHYASYEPASWFFNSPSGPFKVREKYEPGDALWVRETWAQGRDRIIYAADQDATPIGWRSPIHMPRWASRITLAVTGVRIERLQEISEKDAIAEGCRPFFDYDNLEIEPTPDGFNDIEMAPYRTALEAFPKLWNGLHKPGARWDDDPWVVVIEFERER